MYECKIVADSVGENGCRLTTVELTMPRLVLAEHNTHRVFSRNTASSRAMPSHKIMEAVKTNPFIPERFPKNQAGMSNSEWLEGDEHIDAEAQWLYARDQAVKFCENLTTLNVHKQIANRLLEPFMWVTSVTTSTEWNNYFLQRVDKELALSGTWENYRKINDVRENPFPAQYEIQNIAYLLVNAINESTPELVKIGEWHLPYVTEEDKSNFDLEDLKYISVGRAGRVSYLAHGINNTPEKDIDIAKNRMIVNRHWSPTEHVATPLLSAGFCGNFKGFKQLRKFYHGESGQ